MIANRLPHLVALFLSMLFFSRAVNSQPAIDKSLLSAAVTVMPSECAEGEIRGLLEAGVWHDDLSAVAISIPRKNEYMTFVFRRQPDGSFSGQDVSWIANTVFGVWGFPRSEIERFETKPLKWQASLNGNLLLYVQTRGWREGQRYTGTDVYLVFPDGTLTNR
jgi:hypothetical protein